MAIRTACLWCGTNNDVEQARMHSIAVYCRKCGHRADRIPKRCDCRQCVPPPQLAAEPVAPPVQVNLFEEE